VINAVFIFALLLSLFGQPVAALTRTFDKPYFRPGQAVTVTLTAGVPSGTLAYAIEEVLPIGWTVSDVSGGGNYVGGMIKYGVFFDNIQRSFTYKITPHSTAEGVFSGLISLDGSSEPRVFSTLRIDRLAPKSPN